jgi:2-hydroxy-6-oxonona-2,4-dienedioate hydrolase
MNEGLYRAAEERLWRSLGVVPIEHRLHLPRNDVTVRIQEVGEGNPVVFIHGANTSGASWAALASQLRDHRCVILDRPGTGLSEPIRGPLNAERVADLADTLVVDVLDALELDTADVVATSLGGYIALRSAAAHPDRMGRMVQFSWPVGAPIDWLPWFMRVMAVPGIGRLVAAMPATERSVRMTFRRIGHGVSLDAGSVNREDLDAYLAMLRHTDTMRNELGASGVFVSPLRGLRQMLLPADLLARVRTPTHFIWGEHDPFGSPKTGRDLVALLPNATLEVISGAGHAPWLDDLDYCAAAVRAHLDGGPT